MPRITESGVFMPDLIVLVAEICQIKMKNWSESLWIASIWCLQAGWVSRVLKDGTRNWPSGVGFWSSRPASDNQNSRIRLQRVGYGRVGWTALTMCKAVYAFSPSAKLPGISKGRLQWQQASGTLTPHHFMFHQHHTNDFLWLFLKIKLLIINNFVFGSQENPKKKSHGSSPFFV